MLMTEADILQSTDIFLMTNDLQRKIMVGFIQMSGRGVMPAHPSVNLNYIIIKIKLQRDYNSWNLHHDEIWRERSNKSTADTDQ